MSRLKIWHDLFPRVHHRPIPSAPVIRPRAITHSQAQQRVSEQVPTLYPLIIFTISYAFKTPRSILSNRWPDALDHHLIEKLRIDRDVCSDTGRSHKYLLSTARSLSSWTWISLVAFESHPLDILRKPTRGSDSESINFTCQPGCLDLDLDFEIEDYSKTTAD